MAVASVLVVDGDSAALAAARVFLEEAGYAVTQALNGRQALEQFLANPTDVVITEVLMPDGDGIELITALRRTRRPAYIVAVAGRRFLGRLDLLDLATNLGADAALDKPLEAESLVATVTQLLG